MIYFFEGEARQKGAIGITHHFCDEVRAENYEAAVLKLYDKWEHIRITHYNKRDEPLPDDDFLPAGTSDAFVDQFHC